MRGGLKIDTVSAEGGGYEVEQEGTVAPWLKQFAKAQDTIVQQARRRNQAAGYLDNVKNILINRPRYATVEDAVKDFRKRTGLDSYLEEIKQAKAKKPLQKTAKKKASVASRIKTLEKLGLKKKVATEQLPSTLSKYPEAAPNIAAFVKNRIEDLHALGVSIPQLQQGILEIFAVRYGVQDKDVYNSEVEKWLSDQIEASQHLVPPEVSTPQLGAGINEEDSQEDSDAFSGLMPASQY